MGMAQIYILCHIIANLHGTNINPEIRLIITIFKTFYS